jgi:hypothetical protein
VNAPTTIKIDNVEYVRADSVKSNSPVQVVVLDRGFVYVGRPERDDDMLVIRNAKNIRVWGTSKGLGELVNGPTSKTRLDPAGTVRAPMRAVIALIDASESKWTGI